MNSFFFIFEEVLLFIKKSKELLNRMQKCVCYNRKIRSKINFELHAIANMDETP